MAMNAPSPPYHRWATVAGGPLDTAVEHPGWRPAIWVWGEISRGLHFVGPFKSYLRALAGAGFAFNAPVRNHGPAVGVPLPAKGEPLPVGANPATTCVFQPHIQHQTAYPGNIRWVDGSVHTQRCLVTMTGGVEVGVWIPRWAIVAWSAIRNPVMKDMGQKALQHRFLTEPELRDNFQAVAHLGGAEAVSAMLDANERISENIHTTFDRCLKAAVAPPFCPVHLLQPPEGSVMWVDYCRRRDT